MSEYDLDATLTSGQVFGWERDRDGWVNVVAGRWVRLQQDGNSLHAEVAAAQTEWHWLADYLQIQVDLARVLASFPEDEHLTTAVAACRGLRLLRQNPWDCLAHFILSSTKQIVQIQQIVSALRTRFGERVATPPGIREAFAFPSPARLASASETELRDCKMGFRAPYLLETARIIAGGECDLTALGCLDITLARAQLMELPGVGGKIADCVLLFAYGFPEAFPVDTWVARVLRKYYWPSSRRNLRQLQRRAVRYFGPNAGYAQQYLFHHIRTQENQAGVRTIRNPTKFDDAVPR